VYGAAAASVAAASACRLARHRPETTTPEHKAFAAARLAAGAEMLRDLWYTAWVTSAAP
jgi:hypothetical protein